jgi:hypothetical protein
MPVSAKARKKVPGCNLNVTLHAPNIKGPIDCGTPAQLEKL